jgi:anaerobic selenocysteine-containing dehydrogenase
LAELATVSPLHAGVTPAALAESTREGILVEGTLDADRPEPTGVPGRDGYGMRLVVDRSMYDAGVLVAHSRSLAGLAPGTCAGVEPSDLARHGIDEGEVVDLISARGTIQVVVVADAGVARGTVHLRANQPDVDATVLIDATSPVTEVRVGRR